MANRKRNIQVKFYVTAEEKELMEQKMAAPDKADRRLPAEDGDRRIYHPGGHQGH